MGTGSKSKSRKDSSKASPPKSSPSPKKIQQPWPQNLDDAAHEFVEFLTHAEGKGTITSFLLSAYKRFEMERFNRFRSRVEHEREVDRAGSAPYHQPGNLETKMLDDLNMNDVENAFAAGIRRTKKVLLNSVEKRVDDINRLLANIGGYSAQLRSCFARSTVVFLEQEDPKYPFRERIIFSINLPNYELKHSIYDGSSQGQDELENDGRTEVQATWDTAVNALAKIVEATGLKPKYCKNDRRYGRFIMKQDLRSRVNIPDEYFSFTLDYNSQEKIDEMREPYNQIIQEYDRKIKNLETKIQKYPEDSKSSKALRLRRNYLSLLQERDFFIGTTPDPNQLDEGLLFLIEVSTLKDYHIVKDCMQSIMTRYIFFLSKIAAKDAQQDQDLSQHLNQTEKLFEDSPMTGKSQEPSQVADDSMTASPSKKKIA